MTTPVVRCPKAAQRLKVVTHARRISMVAQHLLSCDKQRRDHKIK